MLASLRRGLRAHALKASPLLLPSRFDPNFRYCSAQLSSAQLSSAQLSSAPHGCALRADVTGPQLIPLSHDLITQRGV